MLQTLERRLALARVFVKRPRETRTYEDRGGARVVLERLDMLPRELEFLRDPPMLETFDPSRVQAHNIRVTDVSARDPRDWPFIYKGRSWVDNACRAGEIESEAIRRMALDSYCVAAAMGELMIDRVRREAPGKQTIVYDRALKLDRDRDLLWFAGHYFDVRFAPDDVACGP